VGAFKGPFVCNRPNPVHFALEKPWEDVIPEWLCSRGLLANGSAAKQDWLAWMAPFVAVSPVPVKTVFDWFWWVTYACKYQHDLLRVFYNRTGVSEELRANVINFYESDDFHRWSFHRHHEKMPDKMVWASYKMPLKDVIYEHTKDSDYRAVKAKVQSVRNSWGFELGITDRWEVISFGSFSVSIRRMREKYGKDLDRFLTGDALMMRDANCKLGEEDFAPQFGANAIAADAGFLTLAAFNNAEVFDPSNRNHQNDQMAAGAGGE